MSEDKIYDKCNSEVKFTIIFAQAASINAKLRFMSPESFLIGSLMIGKNDVTKALLSQKINLESLLKNAKNILASMSKEHPLASATDVVSPDKASKNIFSSANKLIEKYQLKEDVIDLNLFFIALASNNDIKAILRENNVNVVALVRQLEKNKIQTPKNQDKTSTKEKKTEGDLLKTFCVNLNQEALDNKFDPILCRDHEIESAITILCRKVKSNPILVGPAGTGKTAIAEGIAQRIVSGTVPSKIQDSIIYSLNLGSLVAGTKYRGEFEERLRKIIDELKAQEKAILFIDEIHTIIGTGNSNGALDAANMLKPELARNLKCIGATTEKEYKEIFISDGALSRRFEKIEVEEPSEENTINILKGIKERFESHHNCHISDDAIEKAVRLSGRYNNTKNFPDKAIDCLDTACAKLAWKAENERFITELEIAEVISEQCKIPLEMIMWDNYERVLNTEKILKNSIFGQDHAIDSISRVLKNAYSGVRNPNKPIGIFVMGGESGTGKTYTAKQLAKALFNNESSFIRLDMSEYSEPHSISKIVGSPPGYVGFKDADIVADKLKNRPYSVLLLDEIEKAHPNVLKVFLQIMSDGYFKDAHGNQINCKNLIIIMTGNFNLHEDKKESLGFNKISNISKIDTQKQKIINFCKDAYGAEFVNRIDEFIPFAGISEEVLKMICKKEIESLINRIDRKNVKIKVSDSVYNFMIEARKSEHGINAMIVDRIISKHIEPKLADALLQLENNSQIFYNITITVVKNEITIRKKIKS